MVGGLHTLDLATAERASGPSFPGFRCVVNLVALTPLCAPAICAQHIHVLL